MKKKNLAFTLAEVLIVIGIIGVVAALTLPNLNHATGDKETVTKVKKIYSSLTEAVDRAQAVYGNVDTWFEDIKDDNEARSRRMAKRISEFMKVSKDCGFNEGCFSTAPVLDFKGNTMIQNDLNKLNAGIYYMMELSDGTSIAFTANKYVSEPYIVVDIDGSNKGKNKDGLDRFHFGIQSNMLKAIVVDEEDLSKNINEGYDLYYELWILQNDNLDYLKCPDELNWETKTSCE